VRVVEAVDLVLQKLRVWEEEAILFLPNLAVAVLATDRCGRSGKRAACCYNRSQCTDLSMSRNGVLVEPAPL
jgi:hypothetical protein